MLRVHPGGHRLVTGLGGQVGQLLEVAGTRLERAPGGDVLAQRLGFAQDLLGLSLIIPEAGLARAGIQLREAPLPTG
jgi:hypothetical protein